MIEEEEEDTKGKGNIDDEGEGWRRCVDDDDDKLHHHSYHLSSISTFYLLI